MGSSQAHYSEITFGSMNSSERPITLTQEDNSNISDPHQECSGESSEECFPTRPPEVKLPCRDSRSSKVCHILMTKEEDGCPNGTQGFETQIIQKLMHSRRSYVQPRMEQGRKLSTLLRLRERFNPRPSTIENRRKNLHGKRLSPIANSQKLMQSLPSSASDHEAIHFVVINTFKMV